MKKKRVRVKNSHQSDLDKFIIPMGSELLDKTLLFLKPPLLLSCMDHDRVYNCVRESPLVLNSIGNFDNLPMEECKKILSRRAIIRRAIHAGTKPARVVQVPQRDMTQILVYNGFVFTASDDGTVCCFDMRCEFIRTFTGHKAGIWTLDAINNLLVTGSVDRTAMIWKMSDGTHVTTLKRHRSTIRVLLVTEKHIITGSRDFTIGVWGLDGAFLHLLQGHRDSVRCMDCDGRFLVTGSYDGSVRLWDYKNGKALRIICTGRGKIYSVKLHGNYVASTGADNIVEVATLDGRFSVNHIVHFSHVVWLDFSCNYLLSSGADCQVVKYNYTKNTIVYKILEKEPIKCQKIYDDILIVGTLKEIRLYCFVTGNFLRTILKADLISKIEVADNKIFAGYSMNATYYMAVFEYDLGK
ncbi:F-box and WD-40 domain protein 7 [Pancytospora epiphaga]|nr:F-box and WD-40 domain protein 7 [Pancytospora epiphaga]